MVGLKVVLNGFKVFFWVGNGIIDYIYTSTTSKVTAVCQVLRTEVS